MSDDEMLVRAVSAGEKTAYAKLYDRYAPLVRALCYDATGNLADAQDLTQDVFMRAYEKIGNLHTPSRFGSWIVSMARLRCKEWYRRNRKTQKAYAELRDMPETSCHMADNSRSEQLGRMLAALPEKERLALHTFYLLGNSAENARRVMGLSRSGFYRVLERARKRLARLMANYEGDK
jgi:RNA polymerase sigma-70 factor (ECF subfamily)